jgi:ABC-type amino acid transport system permease subunit
LNSIDIDNLPLSSKASLCWSFFWRAIVTSLGSAVCGGLLGGIVGVIFGLAGTPKVAVAVGGVLGIGCGAFFLYVFIRWLLSSRLGRYKLLLVNTDDAI